MVSLPVITTPTGLLQKVAYDIPDFLQVINAAYLAAQNAVVTAGGAAPYGQVVMTFAPATGLFSLNIPAYYGTGTVGVTGAGIGVHMSYALWQKFQSFPAVQNSPLLYNNHDVTFRRQWTGNNQIPATDIYTGTGTQGTGGNYYMVLTQDAPWPSSILDTTRLVITSSSLPLVNEYKANSAYTQMGGGGGNQTIPIVTDFVIGRDAPFQSRGEPYVYFPPFYRLTTLRGSSPLTQWDIRVYVVDTLGNLFQLYLSPGSSIDIKLLFLHKGLTN